VLQCMAMCARTGYPLFFQRCSIIRASRGVKALRSSSASSDLSFFSPGSSHWMKLN